MINLQKYILSIFYKKKNRILGVDYDFWTDIDETLDELIDYVEEEDDV